MKRVTGIGGLFFKSNEPKKLSKWYQDHLGINYPNKYGGLFEWKDKQNPEEGGIRHTVFSVFNGDSNYFEPSNQKFMFNFRVENLEELLKVLAKEGVTVVGKMEVYEYGKFGWVLDPDGNKIELWEPNDKVFREVNEYDK